MYLAAVRVFLHRCLLFSPLQPSTCSSVVSLLPGVKSYMLFYPSAIRTCRNISVITGLHKTEHKYGILNTFGVGRVFMFAVTHTHTSCVSGMLTLCHTNSLHTHTLSPKMTFHVGVCYVCLLIKYRCINKRADT